MSTSCIGPLSICGGGCKNNEIIIEYMATWHALVLWKLDWGLESGLVVEVFWCWPHILFNGTWVTVWYIYILLSSVLYFLGERKSKKARLDPELIEDEDSRDVDESGIIQKACCHPDRSFWDYYSGALSSSQACNSFRIWTLSYHKDFDTVTSPSANGSAAFKESCTPIG